MYIKSITKWSLSFFSILSYLILVQIVLEHLYSFATYMSVVSCLVRTTKIYMINHQSIWYTSVNVILCEIIYVEISITFKRCKAFKSKTTKILSFQESSKRKFPNHMAKSNYIIHQTNGQQHLLRGFVFTISKSN